MKAVNSHGGGPRGRLIAIIAGVAVLIFVLALFTGGCGDDNGDSDSQNEDGVADGTDGVGGVGSAGGASAEPVMVDYQWDDCITEMTERYGSEETASLVCNAIRTDYSEHEKAELPDILPAIEEAENVTPTGDGGTGDGDDGTGDEDDGGDTGTGGNGWDSGIEIVVPPAP